MLLKPQKYMNLSGEVIKEYVDSLQGNKCPVTISNDGFSRSVSSGNKFVSLEDAKRYVENMFRF